MQGWQLERKIICVLTELTRIIAKKQGNKKVGRMEKKESKIQNVKSVAK